LEWQIYLFGYRRSSVAVTENCSNSFRKNGCLTIFYGAGTEEKRVEEKKGEFHDGYTH
jgi:hypothetical protein